VRIKKQDKNAKVKSMSLGEQVEYINQKLGYTTLIKPPKYWLDLGDPYLNKVMGSKELGIAYGKIYLIAGKPSSGKSAQVAKIAGIAQRDGADIAWVDGENSFEKKHVGRQSLDCGHSIRNKDGDVIGYEKVALFRPEYGMFGYKSKKNKNVLNLEDVEAAEDLFERVETWMKLRRKINPKGKLLVAVDSTTSFAPAEELMAGLKDQNMRTRSSNAVFLNTLLKRWVNLSLHVNAIIMLIAQLRTNPGKMFGNPEYVSGGGGIQYFPSSVVWMRRVKDGAIRKNGLQVGTKGLMSNNKNKVGGGSVERKKCGYIAHFFKDDWKYMSADKIKGVK
jgi:RecA/RadA recombinase